MTQQSTTTSDAAPAERFSLRGMRYGEILLLYPKGDKLEGQVWGTQGVNLCPAEDWEAIDPEAVKEEYGALGIKMNGPRHFLIDFTRGMQPPEAEHRTYGTLEMKLLATIERDMDSIGRQTSYEPISVVRTNVWEFHAGSEVYELIDPDGTVWIMQAYAQIVDPDLTESDLAALGDRLDLPDGWSFRCRILDEDLDVPASADGIATVTQDELQNTYQRLESTVAT